MEEVFLEEGDVLVELHLLCGSGTSCTKSVGTDLSMEDILSLQAEVRTLKEVIAALEDKLRLQDILGQGPEDSLGPACPSVEQRACPEPEREAVCKTEPNQTVLLGLDWNCVNPPTPQDVERDGAGLDTLCKTEPATTVTLLSGWNSENQNTLQDMEEDAPRVYLLCKSERPSLALTDPVCEGEDQDALQEDAPRVYLLCKSERPSLALTDPVCEGEDQDALQEDAPRVSLLCKSERPSLALTDPVCEGEDQDALQDVREDRDDPDPAECNAGILHTPHTPLKRCSVRLLDCRNKLELEGKTAVGEPNQNKGQNKSNNRLCPSGWRSESKESGSRKFPCSVCGKLLASRGILKTHMSLHSLDHQAKPCTCITCGRGFRTPALLQDHLKVHSAEKLFRCEVCGDTFTGKGNMKIHQNIHSVERLQQSIEHYVRRRRLQNHPSLGEAAPVLSPDDQQRPQAGEEPHRKALGAEPSPPGHTGWSEVLLQTTPLTSLEPPQTQGHRDTLSSIHLWTP